MVMVEDREKKLLRLREDIDQIMKRALRDIEDESLKNKVLNTLVQVRELLVGS